MENMYGIGCMLLLVIVVGFVWGDSFENVIKLVKSYIYVVIVYVDDLKIGGGYGLVYYFYVFWSK